MQDAFKTPSRFRAEIPMEYIVQEEKEEAPKHPKVVVSQSLTGRPSKLGANKKRKCVYVKGMPLNIQFMVRVLCLKFVEMSQRLPLVIRLV